MGRFTPGKCKAVEALTTASVEDGSTLSASARPRPWPWCAPLAGNRCGRQCARRSHPRTYAHGPTVWETRSRDDSARLANAPFVKSRHPSSPRLGYVGRDVDSWFVIWRKPLSPCCARKNASVSNLTHVRTPRTLCRRLLPSARRREPRPAQFLYRDSKPRPAAAHRPSLNAQRICRRLLRRRKTQ